MKLLTLNATAEITFIYTRDFLRVIHLPSITPHNYYTLYLKSKVCNSVIRPFKSCNAEREEENGTKLQFMFLT